MFHEIVNFLKNLTLIDYVFFFTIMILMILIVILIYFVKVNKDNVNIKDLDLNDPNDLKELATTIKSVKKEPIKFTSYEEEQEKKAIISYDELLENKSNLDINYDNEITGDIAIKKVDLNNFAKETDKKVTYENSNLHTISLEHEEAFLEALKQLNMNLN